MPQETFWMVWNEGNRAPTVKHQSEEMAEKEAERLARVNPGQKFYVIQSVKVCSLRDVVWERTQEVPF